MSSRKKLINEVRQRLTQRIEPNVGSFEMKIFGDFLMSKLFQFDSDFNIYRFLLNAERGHKHSRRDVIESAVRALTQHLRLRKCLKLVSGGRRLDFSCAQRRLWSFACL